MRIRAILADIEGTLLNAGNTETTVSALSWLRREGLAMRLLTNTSASTPADLAARLGAAGLAVAAGDIVTAAEACAHYLRQVGGSISTELIPHAARSCFAGIPVDEQAPAHVVVGDMGPDFCYANLNPAFLMLRRGARLVAMQRNMFWNAPEGPRLDAGAFVSALEAATGQAALVTGKPSPWPFRLALASLGLEAGEVLVVGDDPATDIAGARAIGARSVLVQTGRSASGEAGGDADYVIPRFGDLPALLASLQQSGGN